MDRHETVPDEAIKGWPPSKDVFHTGGERVDFHYHDVEEWLQVLEGEIYFFTADEREYRLPEDNRKALRILPGEIHRVEIGPAGVKYRMWTPVDESEESFAHRVGDEHMLLIKRNLELPEVENRWEKRNRQDLSEENREDRWFLTNLLSVNLTFRTAKGSFLGTDQYLMRDPANVVRSSSGSVQILHATPENVLLSTVVHTQPSGGGQQASFSNIRLFVREGGVWKCRVWLNYPDS